MTIDTLDVLRVTARLKYLAVFDVQNVYYVRPVSIGAETQVALRDDLAAWMEDVYDSMIASLLVTMTFDNIEIFNITDNVPEPSVSWPTLVAGAQVGNELPEGVAGLMLGRTGVSKVLGKKYLGVFAEGSMTDGLWEAPFLTSLALAASDWIAPFTGASGVTWDPGIWSPVPLLFRTFTEAVTNNIPAYQRRRKRGVGS